MANKKMSDTAVFKTGASNVAYNDIKNIDGVVGWSNFTGTDENVAISGTQLVASLETNLYTTTPLPIVKGGTGIGPAPADPAGVLGVPFVGKLISESTQNVGDQLVISNDGGTAVLNTIPNSFSFMVTVNQAIPEVGFISADWFNAGWEYGATGGAFTKYTQTSANPKLRKSHFKEQEGNCELEMTFSLCGQASGTYDWELRLVDPTGGVASLTVASSASVGATPTMNDFESGAPNWGAGWQQVRVTGVNLSSFFTGAITEGELELYINANDKFANVGCSCRFMSL